MSGALASLSGESGGSIHQGAAKHLPVIYRFPSGERLSSTSAHARAEVPSFASAVNELPGSREAEAVRAEWSSGADPAYQPARTELGALLRELRRVSLASRPRLLDWDGIEREMDVIRSRDRRP